jgi:hypothetical protein
MMFRFTSLWPGSGLSVRIGSVGSWGLPNFVEVQYSRTARRRLSQWKGKLEKVASNAQIKSRTTTADGKLHPAKGGQSGLFLSFASSKASIR